MKWYIFVLFFSSQILNAQSHISKLEELFKAKNYKEIRKSYYSKTESYSSLSSIDKFYLGYSLFLEGEILNPVIILSQLGDDKSLKPSFRKRAKKTCDKINRQGIIGLRSYQNGNIKLKNGQYKSAKKDFEDVSRVDSMFLFNYYKLLYIARKQKNLQEFNSYASKIKKCLPISEEVLVQASKLQFDITQSCKDAIFELKELKDVNPPLYYRTSAMFYEKKDSFNQALRCLHLIDVKNRRDDFKKRVGELYHNAGKYKISNDYLIPFFKENKEKHVAKLLAMNFYNLGNYQSAIKLCDFLIKNDNKHHYAYYLKGLSVKSNMTGILYRNPENLIAEKWFKKAIAIDSTVQRYYNSLATVIHNFQREDEALEMIEKSLQLDSLNIETWDVAMVVLMDQSKKERALGKRMINAYEKAFKQDSSNANYSFGLAKGYQLASEGLFSKYSIPYDNKSIYYLKKAIKLYPHNFDFYKELNLMYSYCSEREKYKNELIELLKMTIKYFPYNGYGYRELFFTYRDLEDYEKANDIYLRLIKAVPNYSYIDQIRNSIYSDRKKYNWTKLPVEVYKSTSWKYLDSITNVLSNKDWTSDQEGCNSNSRRFQFKLSEKTMKVTYRDSIDWQDGKVKFLIYDILGVYKNGLRVRIQGEHRKDYRGKAKEWDLVLFNEKYFKWRRYPTHQPFYFNTALQVCE